MIVPQQDPVPLLQADDRTLVGRAADGDSQAFAVIVRRHGPVMRAYARKLLGSTDEVDDVVQDTFIDAWKRLSDLRDAATLRSWLMRIVSHKSVDRIRARRYHDDIDQHEIESPTATFPENISVRRSRENALGQVLSALPERQRQCWTLKEIGGYSYDQIAESLALPSSTVRGLLARARRIVTKEMEGWE